MEEPLDDEIAPVFHRAEELANSLSSQQLLGYIAALLEATAMNQVNTTKLIIQTMEANTFEVSGNVSIMR